jgi:ribosomal-protein-alanine N-acetyltransferase
MKFEYESENLIYRILGSESADEVLSFYTRNRETFDAFEPPKPASYFTHTYHESLLRMEQEQFLRSTGGRFWIYEKNAPDRICGCVSFNNVIRGCFGHARIGYKIDQSRQNLGLGTQAVSFCTNLLHRESHLHRIEAYIHEKNEPSIRLARKCGYIHEGTAVSFARLSTSWTDMERYVHIGEEV